MHYTAMRISEYEIKGCTPFMWYLDAGEIPERNDGGFPVFQKVMHESKLVPLTYCEDLANSLRSTHGTRVLCITCSARSHTHIHVIMCKVPSLASQTVSG